MLHQVETPLLLLLGNQDRRVPMEQSIEYYHTLRARGIPVKMLVYPMNHSLTNSVAGKANVWIQTLLWFQKYDPALSSTTNA